MRVGYFTQYQVEELDRAETPLQHMTRLMPGKSPSAVRAQLGRFGFGGPKATTEVGRLSGGERARLALALITRDAPHMLILDEPTNHLDVDAREALIQALNAYDGAVVMVSHDRHMIETTADRLVLVDGGTAREYAGSLDDYIALVLAKDAADSGKAGAKARPQGGAPPRRRGARGEPEAEEAGARGRGRAGAAGRAAQRDRPGDVRSQDGGSGAGEADDGRADEAARRDRDQGRGDRGAVDRGERGAGIDRGVSES